MSDSVVVKHRKVVSKGQLEVLELLYKFRFGSIELLRISLGLNEGPGLYNKLKILIDKGYVGKRYDSSYKIRGTPAGYYLRTKGFRELQKHPGFEAIDEKLIKYSAPKDKIVGQPFIAENLRIYNATLELQRLYPQLKYFTKRQLSGRKNFPKQLPDGFVSLKVEGHDKPFRYYLDIIVDGTPRYEVDNIITNYYEFFESYDWEKKTQSKLPAILLLCESGSCERRLQKWVARKRRSLDSDEPEYFTSTLKALKNAGKEENNIWSSVEDPEELLALEDIT